MYITLKQPKEFNTDVILYRKLCNEIKVEHLLLLVLPTGVA